MCNNGDRHFNDTADRLEEIADLFFGIGLLDREDAGEFVRLAAGLDEAVQALRELKDPYTIVCDLEALGTRPLFEPRRR